MQVYTLKIPLESVTIFAFSHQKIFKELKRKIGFYIYPDVYHFWCSSFSTDVPIFLLVCNFPSIWRTSFSNFWKQVFWQLIVLFSFIWYWVYFSLIPDESFLLFIESWVDSSFFNHLKNVSPFLFGLHDFRWEIWIHLNFYFW